ncbi:MAG: Lrp/AsnC family transcriptional regulator of ectoine degradation [Paracoccaceae bacterium]|jgi:Lrp/AsnC family transcriptional regulator of ectoine degradation
MSGSSSRGVVRPTKIHPSDNRKTCQVRSNPICDSPALGGGFDYLMQIVTSDIDAYQRLIDEMLEARIGLARYFTYVVTKAVKGGGAPPLELLLNR